MASSETTTLLALLSKVQQELKAPKSQRNTFGNYNYRKAEDILEAAKPLLAANGITLILTDELVQVGDRYYIKAAAKVFEQKSPEFWVESYGWAREELDKKGMDASQITGAAASYARKYALNGLFLIDDSEDADATNHHDKKTVAQTAPAKPQPTEPLTAEQIAELMQIAKNKGYSTKEEATTFLDVQAAGPFTKVPAEHFAEFKKTVISAGWKKS